MENPWWDDYCKAETKRRIAEMEAIIEELKKKTEGNELPKFVKTVEYKSIAIPCGE